MTEPTNGARPSADFTVDRSPHAFRLGGVDYQAPAVIGGPTLKKAAALVAGMSGAGEDAEAGAAIDKIAEAFGILIPGPVGQAIRERIATDEENPIDLRREALPAFYWLMEKYGMRPTQPPSNSPDGSTETITLSETTSSTGGASPEASDNPSLPQLTG